MNPKPRYLPSELTTCGAKCDITKHGWRLDEVDDILVAPVIGPTE